MSDRSFDDLMASMGVRKLESGKTRVKSDPPASMPAPAKSRPASKARQAPAPVATGPSKSERRLRAEVERVAAELAEAKQHLVAAESERVALRAELDGAKAAHEAQNSELQRMHAELALARGDGERKGSGISSRFAHRGVLGEDERRLALASLGERRILDSLLKRLVVADTRWVDAWLEQQLVLVCGSEDCRGVSGLAAVEVSAARCELCGGKGLDSGARSFVSGLLLNGWHRCVIVGGPVWLPRVLSGVLADPRIELEVMPWSSLSGRIELQLQGDPEVAVSWSSTDQDGPSIAVNERVKSHIQTSAGSVGEMLTEAARALIGGG